MNILRFLSRYKLFLLTLAATGVLTILPANFKLFVALCFVLFAMYWFVTKNMFFSLCAMLFLTQHFLSPGKYYSFTLIEAGILRSEPYRTNGIIDGYGLLASDIFALLIIVYFVRLFMTATPQDVYRRIYRHFSDGLHRFLFSCWAIYTSVTLYSSLFLSFHPVFSVVNLLQFGKIIVFYIVFTMLFSKKNSLGLTNVGMLLAGFSFSNAYLGISQFLGDVQQSLLGGRSTEFYSAVEYEMRVSAPKGYYLHSNEFAMFSLIWALILLRLYQISKNKVLLFAIFLNMLGVLMSQSRTVWLIGFSLLFIHIRLNLETVQKLMKNTRVKIYALLGICIILALTLPRIASLQYSGQEGSLSVRVDMIRQGMEIFHLNPWIGFGTHTGVHVMYEYITWGYIQDFPFEIHNAYLQMALESGIIGVVAFFLPFIILTRVNLLGLLYRRISGKVTFNPFLVEALLVYYIIQPHSGRLEIPLLGIVLAFVKTYYYDHGK